jgi:uncharacterized protein with HEPN domain
MLAEERDLAHLWDMRAAAQRTVEFVGESTYEEYSQNAMMQSAVERQLEIVGEAARRVSEKLSAGHSEIPWRDIIAQRNVLTHEYGEVVPERVWDVVKHHVPPLITALNALLPSQD